MSWNHAQCYDCWIKENRIGFPVKVRDHKPEKCCFCGRWTIEGIFVRRDPKKMRCCHDPRHIKII